MKKIFTLLFSMAAISAHAQTFTNQNSNLPGLEGGAVTWADLDGDGDKDLILV